MFMPAKTGALAAFGISVRVHNPRGGCIGSSAFVRSNRFLVGPHAVACNCKARLCRLR